MAEPTPEPSSGLIDKVQQFISENKKALIIGTAAAIAVGGVAYYASTSSSTSTSSSRKDKKDSGKKRGEKGGKKKKPGVNDADGPLLEERKPRVKEEFDDELPPLEDISAMSLSERKELAAQYKTKGNNAYKDQKYQIAADMYTRAIEIASAPEPVFYSNRAACYLNVKPPKYDLVIADCDVALKLDPVYAKAMNRRGTALEHLERYEEALRDFTACTILEKFTNASVGQSVERVLQKLSTKRSKEILSSRKPRLPSFNFVSAYLAAFRPRGHPTPPGTSKDAGEGEGDDVLLEALKALDAQEFEKSLALVEDAIRKGVSWDVGRSEAHNLRGTFRFLMNDVEGSKSDFLESIKLNPSDTQSLVKVASVYMEQTDPKKAFECFDNAIKINPSDPDIYYHRGQVLFIMGQFDEAAQNYTKSSELDPDFVFSHIQLAVAQYKSENVSNSLATFRRTIKMFPKRSEVMNYYGELLLDLQRFPDAIEKFDKAIELEKEQSKQTPNVLPYVNKSLALYQWKQDFISAQSLCEEAVKLDPECEAAIASLAQFCLQQGKIGEAEKWLERQVELCRSENELGTSLTYYYATKAQQEFLTNYPDMAPQLQGIAQGIS